MPRVMLAPGDVVDGRYRVERLLGEGGMGAVFAVRDRAGTTCALKVMLDAADATLRKRFEREGRAAARLTSEHATRVFGAGTLEDGTPYFVMEHLEGEDLWDVVHRRGPLTQAEAVAFVLQAGHALREAHSLGMVHRDIKPANLFLTRRPDGSSLVKLLDFGISKAALGTIAPMTQLTQTGTVLGSPEYMSPEQIVSSAEVDHRADLWSLGATLHELLTGTNAFAGATIAEIITNIIRDAPMPLRSLRSDVSEALETVVLRCLEKDPDDRYASMDALAQALRATTPSGFETSPTLAPTARGLRGAFERNTGSAAALAHAPTLAQPSVDLPPVERATTTSATSAAVSSLAPSALPRVAEHAATMLTPPNLSFGVATQGASAPGARQAPTRVSAPPPLASAAARQPRRWWWVVVAVLCLGAVGAGVLRQLGPRHRERRGSTDAPPEKRGKQRPSDDSPADGDTSLLQGDLQLPKVRRVALLARLASAEGALERGDLSGSEAAAQKVLDAIVGVAPPSALAHRAENLQARVAGARTLDNARAVATASGSDDVTHPLGQVAFFQAQDYRHLAQAAAWNPRVRNCLTLGYAQRTRAAVAMLRSATEPQRRELVTAYANVIVGQGLEAIKSLEKSDEASCRAELDLATKKLKQLHTRPQELP